MTRLAPQSFTWMTNSRDAESRVMLYKKGDCISFIASKLIAVYLTLSVKCFVVV